VCQEAAMQRIGINLEHLVERAEREPAGLDPVVAEQDGLRDGVSATIESPEPIRCPKCIPALGLGITLRRVWRCPDRSET
jgi:hypothetical protein